MGTEKHAAHGTPVPDRDVQCHFDAGFRAGLLAAQKICADIEAECLDRAKSADARAENTAASGAAWERYRDHAVRQRREAVAAARCLARICAKAAGQ